MAHLCITWLKYATLYLYYAYYALETQLSDGQDRERRVRHASVRCSAPPASIRCAELGKLPLQRSSHVSCIETMARIAEKNSRRLQIGIPPVPENPPTRKTDTLVTGGTLYFRCQSWRAGPIVALGARARRTLVLSYAPSQCPALQNAEIKARGFSAKEHFARLFVVQVVLGDVVLLC